MIMPKEYSPVKSAITSSQVAGELYRASGIARQLSLAAKNSQAVVHRAGSKVAGLKVISEYFADLALKTIKLAEEINTISLDISHMAVERWRQNTLVGHLYESQAKTENDTVAVIIASTKKRQLDINNKFNTEIRRLENQLSEIQQHMQASRVVAVSFRLESTQSDEYQGILEDMASNIDVFSEQIKQHVLDAKSHIDRLLMS
jgi:ABC-type phosphate transport system auxiliary subunit